MLQSSYCFLVSAGFTVSLASAARTHESLWGEDLTTPAESDLRDLKGSGGRGGGRSRSSYYGGGSGGGEMSEAEFYALLIILGITGLVSLIYHAVKKKWHHRIWKPKEPVPLTITMNDLVSDRKTVENGENNLDQPPALGGRGFEQPDLDKNLDFRGEPGQLHSQAENVVELQETQIISPNQTLNNNPAPQQKLLYDGSSVGGQLIQPQQFQLQPQLLQPSRKPQFQYQPQMLQQQPQPFQQYPQMMPPSQPQMMLQQHPQPFQPNPPMMVPSQPQMYQQQQQMSGVPQTAPNNQMVMVPGGDDENILDSNRE